MLADATLATRALELTTIAAVSALVLESSDPTLALLESYSTDGPQDQTNAIVYEADLLVTETEEPTQVDTSNQLLVDSDGGTINTPEAQSNLSLVEEPVAGLDEVFSTESGSEGLEVSDQTTEDRPLYDEAAVMDALLTMGAAETAVQPEGLGEQAAATNEAVSEVVEVAAMDQLIDGIIGSASDDGSGSSANSGDAALASLLDMNVSESSYTSYGSELAALADDMLVLAASQT